MAVLTVAECKTILGITGSSYDRRISDLIPYVQSDILDYCNNAFTDKVIYKQSGADLEFVRGSTLTSSTVADKITDVADEFTTCGFRAGMDIYVDGGSNTGYYTVAAVSTDTLTLTSSGELEDQAQTTYYRWPGEMRISNVIWPKALKAAAARMIGYTIDNPKPRDIQSESIDDYSVTYAGQTAYPKRVIASLNQYKRVHLV